MTAQEIVLQSNACGTHANEGGSCSAHQAVAEEAVLASDQDFAGKLIRIGRSMDVTFRAALNSWKHAIVFSPGTQRLSSLCCMWGTTPRIFHTSANAWIASRI